MTNRNLSIFNKLRPVSVGFDSVFDHFESTFNDDFLIYHPRLHLHIHLITSLNLVKINMMWNHFCRIQ